MLTRIKSLPISVKLIGTTAPLVLLTIGLYGLMNILDQNKVYDESRAEQQEMILEAVSTDARNVTAAVAQTSAILIAATAYGDLEALIKGMRDGDARLVYVQVFEGPKAVVTQGDPLAAQKSLRRVEGGADNGEGITYFHGADGQPRLIRARARFRLGSSTTAEAGGRVEAGWSIANLVERNAAVTARVERRKHSAMLNAVAVGALIFLLGVVLTILQSLRITRPIRDLTRSVERLAAGDLSERTVVDSNDEIGGLSRNINDMAERLGVLLLETKEKATLEKEMEVARIIQESLLPPSRLIRRGYVEFMGFFKSASICGGDWWSYSDLSEDRLLMVIGDVTGHGVSSAMITAAAKSCCDTLRNVTEGEITASFLLEELNKTIYEAAHRKFVMTFFATIIDPRSQTITFSNAGHNFPLLFRANPKPGEPAIVPLVTRGNRLGDVMTSRFLERTVPHEAGDVLVWYTDGLTEGVGKDGKEFGEKRFRRCIRSVLDRPADEILGKVISDAEAFFENFTHPEDDITLVIGKFTESRVEASPNPPATEPVATA